MSKINYVVREDGMPVMFGSELESAYLSTADILEDYSYIVKAMQDEEYYIKNDECHLFDEILFENKVVGFATFNVGNYQDVLLTECYILPEFRGKRLFFDELAKMIFSCHHFGMLQPTRNIVELLLSYAFAKNVTENIVVSAIEFYFDEEDVKSDKRSKISIDELHPSNFYDLEINSTIQVNEDEVFYHKLLENDYRYGDRKELTEEYFSNIKELFSKNHEEYEKLSIELKDELPKFNMGYDEIIGNGDGLSEYMQGIVDNDIVSYETAIKIKEQLIEEYESGEINEDELDDRLSILVSNEISGISNFREFREIVELEDDGEEDTEAIKDFLDVIGDNEVLGTQLLNALFSGDEEEFHRLLIDAMGEDEEFMDNFLNLVMRSGGNDDEMEDAPFLDFSNEEEEIHQYRLEDLEYGKDYPISYDREIYSVLDLLNDGIHYEMIMGFLEFDSSLNHDMLTGMLLHSNLIKKDEIEIDWLNKASEFSKADLKEILKSNNLKVSGNKPDLLKRLADNNVTFGETYVISEKGKNYLKEFSWIEFYQEFLYEFDFDDFYRFFESHDGNLKEISLNYIDEHIKIARKNDDREYLENCIFMKKVIIDEADEFISDLNSPE